MKGDQVPDEDHISRYCGGSHCHEDGSIDGTAFRLRTTQNGPETYLSVNWLEYLNKDGRDAEIEEIRCVLKKKFSRIGSTAKIAVLNVGGLREHVLASPDARNLNVIHEPENPIDPSHSGVYGLTLDDDLIADMISEAVQDIYPAKA